MNKKSRLLIIFSLAAIAQIALPLSMIAKRELVLRNGEPFKFRARPVDPYDPFRGRFVELTLQPTSAPWGEPTTESGSQRGAAYALITTNADGFAEFSVVRRSPPNEGPYLRVELSHLDGSDRAHFRLPTDRFYMEETVAPKAERLVRTWRSTNSPPLYALVRVRHGVGVIENVYVGEKTLAETASELEPYER